MSKALTSAPQVEEVDDHEFATDFEEHIRAGYQCLYIPTSEEARLTAEIARVAKKMTYGVIHWDVVQGFSGLGALEGDKGKKYARNPLAPLEFLLSEDEQKAYQGNYVFLFRDLDDYLHDPMVRRALRTLTEENKLVNKKHKRPLVIVSPKLQIPDKLKASVSILEFSLPSEKKLNKTFDFICSSIESKSTEKAKCNEELKDDIIACLLGLTTTEAENALSRCLVQHGGFTREMLSTIKEEKAAIIKKSEVLTYIPEDVAATRAEIGGFDLLLEWLDRRRLAYDRKARELNIDYPKGIVLLGVPGTGKSYVAKAVSKLLGLPGYIMDVGAVFGHLVGESLHGDQEIYFCSRDGRCVERKTIREAYESQEHLPCTYSFTDGGGFVCSKVTAVIRHERKEKFLKVITKRGMEIIVTEGHSLFKRETVEGGEFPSEITDRGGRLQECRADALKPGDRIATCLNIGQRRNTHGKVTVGNMSIKVDEQLATLAGLWVGDGSLNHYRVRISGSSDEPEILDFLQTLGQVTVYAKEGKGRDYTLNAPWYALALQALDVTSDESHADTKRVPAWMFGMDESVIAAFLRGYFSADGSMSGHNFEVGTRSHKLALDVAGLLRTFRIAPYIKRVSLTGRPFYRLQVSKAAELEIIRDKIGFLVEHKQAALDTYLDGQEICGRTKQRQRYSVLWDEVVEVGEFASDDQYSYDLSVEGTEKFMSNWIVVHNSEQRMRDALNQIEAQKGCVLLVDEADKAFGGAADAQGDSGVTRRVFGKFLTWLSEKQDRTFVIMTMNRTRGIPPEFLRAGRFDAVFYTDLPTPTERRQILDIHLRKRGVDPVKLNFAPADWKTIIDKTSGFVGSEMEEVVREARYRAYESRKEGDPTYDELYEAASTISPMSQRDPEGVNEIRNYCKERAKPVSSPERTNRGGAERDRSVQLDN